MSAIEEGVTQPGALLGRILHQAQPVELEKVEWLHKYTESILKRLLNLTHLRNCNGSAGRCD
jgi:hypothetical protein